MPGNDNLYFIAIIPPEPIRTAITAFKQDMADRFHSKAALKIIPHITLKAPFKLPAGEHDTVVQWFHRLPVTQQPFHIDLNDFGAFDKRHPVIYIQPVANPDLQALQRIITNSFKNAFPAVGLMTNEKKFNPHITIAYRDLSPASFRAAWREYEEKHYEAGFIADSFHLLQHDDRAWNSIEEFKLPNNQ